MLKNILRIALVILLFVLLVFYTDQPLFAYFEENFNGGFSNPDSWTVDHLAVPIFSADSIVLSAPSGNTFPYIHSSSQIINAEDDIIEVKLKYNSVGSSFGNGVAITDVNPPVNTTMLYPSVFAQYTMFYVWQGPGSPYFHIVTFLCPNTNPSCTPNSPTVVYQSSGTDLSDHVIKITRSGSNYSLYLDDVNKFTSGTSTREAKNVWLGHPETTSTSASWASFSVDYLKIGIPPSPSPTPTPTPSPSPTPTPSPSPSPTPTPFPYLSQKDVAWAEDEYDSASSWAGVAKSGIGRWGCAITSVAMILQKNGVKALDGSIVDPSKLNTWLKTQTDGYIGPGLLNWLAITRYTKESYAADYASTKLEYSRPSATSTPVLPTILGLPGHFVVAYDEDSTNWQINDPASESAKLLSKTSTIKSINRFTPSSTDLSYMMFVTNGSVTGDLKDKNGDIVEIDWTDEYLSDDVEGGDGEIIRTGMLAKPSSGTYQLTATQPESGANSFQIYLYDNLAAATLQTYTLSGASTLFEITYGSDPSDERTSTKVDQTPPVLTNVPLASENPTNSSTQNWSWEAATDDDSGVSGYSTRTYNVTASSYLDDWLWIGQVLSATTNLAEGKWKLNLKAKDSAGNESSVGSSETLTVDTTVPILSSQTSLTDKWYKTAPTVTFVYSDDNLKGDYVSPTCEITTESSASYCWVKPYICDTAGNCNNDKKFSQNIKLDLTKPTISLNVWGSELKGTASDSLSGVAKVVIQLTKPGSTEETIAATGTTNWSYVIDKAQIGSYTVKVMAYDNADNISSLVERTYDINASDPAQATSSTPTPTPTTTPLPTSFVSPNPTFSPLITLPPSPSPSGEVLGSETVPKKVNYLWLWLIAPTSLIVYLLALKK